MARATETIELTASEEEGGFVRLRASVARDAVVSFRGRDLPGLPNAEPEKTYRVYRSVEALGEQRTLDSFTAAPLLLGHHQDVSPATIAEHQAGYPVGTARKISEGSIGLEYLLTRPAAIEAFRSGRMRQLSPSYEFTPVPAPRGADYDFSATDIRVDHVAQVERGRNGPTIRLFEEDIEMDKAEMKEVLEESNKGLLKGFTKALGKMFGAQADEAEDGDGDGKGKGKGDKPKSKTTITVEEHEAAIKAIDRLNKDRAMVQPLLKSEAAKARVSESEDPVEVFGIALGIKEEEAKQHGADTLRGMAIMSLRANESDSGKGSGSWDTINQPDDAGGVPKVDTNKLYEASQKRADRIRAGESAALTSINVEH